MASNDTGPAVYRTVRYGKPKTITVPEGYTDQQDFLLDMREQFTLDLAADQLNRIAAIDDLKFLTGQQWNESVKQAREEARRPVITINRLPAFVAQIVGNRRLNETQIKVVPDNGGTKEAARIREGLTRSIQKTSRADVAYDKAFENSVGCGIGNFQIALNWADGDVFDQDIAIESIPNALAVVWARDALDPTGKDAKRCFVVESMGTREFKKLYPNATPADVTTDVAYLGDGVVAGWFTQDTVRIVNYWRMCKKTRLLAMFKDSTVVDVTDQPPETWLDKVAQYPDGEPILREAERRYAEMWVCTGTDILEGPYTLPISRVPVFRMQGWEINVGEVRERWGLVRFLKDPMRLHNFWRSVIAERLLLAPKAKWVASDEAVEGRESEWRNAHLSDDNLLIYNAESGTPPTFTPPIVIEQGLVQFAEMAVQDIRDVSNIHEASLGVQSNEVSGKAIIARQRVGELGSVGYNNNANDAIEECGRVIDELIPGVYSRPRVVMVIGEEGDTTMEPINGMAPVGIDGPNGPDITAGKYKVSITTGPSYVTKRVEAAESMLNMVNAMPQTMAVAADKIVETQDWPGSQEIARRLRLTLPPGMVEEKDMTPQQRQQQEQAGQAQAMQQQVQMEMVKAELDLKMAQAMEAQGKARLAVAQAELAEANAKKALSEVGVAAEKVAVDERDNRASHALDAVKTAHPEKTEKVNGNGQ